MYLRQGYRQVSCWICCNIYRSSEVHSEGHHGTTCIVLHFSLLPKRSAALQEPESCAIVLHECHSRSSVVSCLHPVCTEISSPSPNKSDILQWWSVYHSGVPSRWPWKWMHSTECAWQPCCCDEWWWWAQIAHWWSWGTSWLARLNLS